MGKHKICRVRKLGARYFNQPCEVLKFYPGMQTVVDVRFRDGTEFKGIPRTYFKDAQNVETPDRANPDR